MRIFNLEFRLKSLNFIDHCPSINPGDAVAATRMLACV